MVCTVGAIGKHVPKRPTLTRHGRAETRFPSKTAAVFHTSLKGGLVDPLLRASNEHLPSVAAISREHEDDQAASAPFFFSILLKAEDIEDDDAHEDAVVGKRSECMTFHK